MDEALFQQLLHEPESATLDFKQAAYPFAHATDEEKSELLKDILAFANAWRRTDAYILIGVCAPPDAPLTVVDIAEHLDDAALQQFINSKTNRPISLSYQQFTHDGKRVGAIQIPKQKRPFYAKKNFGKVQAPLVYVRRGSSMYVANPEQIAEMGEIDRDEKAAAPPVLEVQFASLEEHKSLGTNIVVVSVHRPYNPKNLALYGDSQRTDRFGFSAPAFGKNNSYYRDAAAFIAFYAEWKSIGLMVTNRGSRVANGVRVELAMAAVDGFEVKGPDAAPGEPQQTFLGAIRPRGEPIRELVANVRRDASNWFVSVNFGKVQAGATSFAGDPFFVGSRESSTVSITARVFADELSQPQESQLTLAVASESNPLTSAEVYTFAETKREDE